MPILPGPSLQQRPQQRRSVLATQSLKAPLCSPAQAPKPPIMLAMMIWIPHRTTSDGINAMCAYIGYCQLVGVAAASGRASVTEIDQVTSITSTLVDTWTCAEDENGTFARALVTTCTTVLRDTTRPHCHHRVHPLPPPPPPSL